jgi:hypothetical protein
VALIRSRRGRRLLVWMHVTTAAEAVAATRERKKKLSSVSLTVSARCEANSHARGQSTHAAVVEGQRAHKRRTLRLCTFSHSVSHPSDLRCFAVGLTELKRRQRRTAAAAAAAAVATTATATPLGRGFNAADSALSPSVPAAEGREGQAERSSGCGEARQAGSRSLQQREQPADQHPNTPFKWF